MARTKFEPSDNDRVLIRNMVIAGLDLKKIAEVFNTTENVIADRCRDEVKEGSAHVKAEIAHLLLDKARDGSVQAMIFLAKNKLGWVETKQNQPAVKVKTTYVIEAPKRSESTEAWLKEARANAGLPPLIEAEQPVAEVGGATKNGKP